MTIKQYFTQDNRWLWHCLALVFNFCFWFPANVFNWFGLAEAKFNGLENSQYFLQGFLSLLITGIVAWLFENWQRRKKQKQSATEWKQNAVPDIHFTTLVGFIGFLLVLSVCGGFQHQAPKHKTKIKVNSGFSAGKTITKP